MPAKRPAPKAAKGKKTVSRTVARKAASRKTAERSKAAHARSKPASALRKTAVPHRSGHAAPADSAAARRHPETAPKPPLPFPVPGAHGTASRPAPVQAVDAEEGDGVEGLLAGPRNVQPYIVKRGE